MLAVAGCAHEEKLSNQPAKAVAQIQSWVPIGTTQADARRIMERHHFTCSVMTRSSFGDLKAADFLYCDRRVSDTRAAPRVVRRWQVAFVLIHGKVSGVRVSMGLMDP